MVDDGFCVYFYDEDDDDDGTVCWIVCLRDYASGVQWGGG